MSIRRLNGARPDALRWPRARSTRPCGGRAPGASVCLRVLLSRRLAAAPKYAAETSIPRSNRGPALLDQGRPRRRYYPGIPANSVLYRHWRPPSRETYCQVTAGLKCWLLTDCSTYATSSLPVLGTTATTSSPRYVSHHVRPRSVVTSTTELPYAKNVRGPVIPTDPTPSAPSAASTCSGGPSIRQTRPAVGAEGGVLSVVALCQRDPIVGVQEHAIAEHSG